MPWHSYNPSHEHLILQFNHPDRLQGRAGLIAVGSEAMQSSLAVYDYVKTAAKHQPGLKTTAEQLGERFTAISRAKRQKKDSAE